MMSGIVAAAAITLVIAGIAKLARPEATAAAVRAAGVRVGVIPAQVLGLIEILLGAVVLGWAPVPAVIVLALAYVGFALFTLRLLTVRGAAASCGCFGVTDAPAHPIHVVVNVGVATALCVALATGEFSAIASNTLLVAVASVLLAASVVMALTLLPSLLIAAAEFLERDDR